MSTADAAQLVGYLFSAWVAGFVCGLTIQAFRRFVEQI